MQSPVNDETGMDAICDDLAAEIAALDIVLAGVADWDLASAAEGWSIRDTVSHLWFFDQRALLALEDPDAFGRDAAVLIERGTDVSLDLGREHSVEEIVAGWQRDRAALIAAARTVEPSARIPWYGPSMSARSFITARLMEVWAHGQDIVDVVGIERAPTARLRHIAHIGVRARPYSYLVHEMALPPTEIRVELTAPDGDLWEWGDADLEDRVSGTALDFCLLVTQRRHRRDTALEVRGASADEWMSIAQAFAGPAGSGRTPLTG